MTAQQYGWSQLTTAISQTEANLNHKLGRWQYHYSLRGNLHIQLTQSKHAHDNLMLQYENAKRFNEWQQARSLFYQITQARVQAGESYRYFNSQALDLNTRRESIRGLQNELSRLKTRLLRMTGQIVWPCLDVTGKPYLKAVEMLGKGSWEYSYRDWRGSQISAELSKWGFIHGCDVQRERQREQCGQHLRIAWG